MNLVQKSVSYGGKLAPIIIPHGLTSGTGLMNPSIYIDDDGDILVNLRHVNYTLYHSENTQRFISPWGPLAYLHPEKDLTLRTYNYLCRLNTNLEVTDFTQVDTSVLDVPPYLGVHWRRGRSYCSMGKRLLPNRCETGYHSKWPRSYGAI